MTLQRDERLRLVLGGPGCGKTTRLLSIVQEEMESGVYPRQIAFVTFTKAAAREAQERAANQFGLDPDKDLPWFRTIHSLAYSSLGLSRDEVMAGRDWRELSTVTGEELSGSIETDSFMPSGSVGNQMLRIIDYSSNRLISLEEAWHELGQAVDWWRLRRFDEAFAAYKADCGKMDFNDMVFNYSRHGEPVPVRVAVIDEAQDLTTSQWASVARAFSTAERIYVGGDDDQAIYKWSGADVDYFLRLSEEPQVLEISHRLPLSIFHLAQQISSRISHRYTKPYRPATNEKGHILYHAQPDSLNLAEGEGSWLVLARNNYLLRPLEEMVRSQGVPYRTRRGAAIDPKHVEAIYFWESLRSGKREEMGAKDVRLLFKALDRPVPQLKEMATYRVGDEGMELPLEVPWYDALVGISLDDREYYKLCLRRGYRLRDEPKVRIETIHGVKGAEADHVMLLTDISYRTSQGFEHQPDTEHRVFYVGVTRARKSLHIVMPQTDISYPV